MLIRKGGVAEGGAVTAGYDCDDEIVKTEGRLLTLKAPGITYGCGDVRPEFGSEIRSIAVPLRDLGPRPRVLRENVSEILQL